MASEDSELLYESILLRSRYHRGWRGLLLVLCFRNLPLLGQMRLQPSLVCHGELRASISGSYPAVSASSSSRRAAAEGR
jgi:hypothetical protein